MERVAIVARLKEGSGSRAAELIAAGPPFDLAETGIAHHSVYLSATEVVFVFEGHQVEWMVDDLINDPFRPDRLGQRAMDLVAVIGRKGVQQPRGLVVRGDVGDFDGENLRRGEGDSDPPRAG